MTIQTLTRQTFVPTNDPVFAIRRGSPNAIVAAEGSELASQLRSAGWVARSGWRSHAPGRPAVWHVRFEHPSLAGNVAVVAA